MHDHEAKLTITSPLLTLGEDRTRNMMIAFLIGVIFLGGGSLLAFVTGGGMRRFAYAYLTNFCFFVSIALGALFFVMSQHLTRAGWSVTIRRIAEYVASLVVLMLILFIPILLLVLSGSPFPFEWNPESWVANAGEMSEIYSKKANYLNSLFFSARGIIYFVVWIGIAVFLLRNSLKQDQSKSTSLTSRMQAFCAPLMIVFAATIVFASFDWQMSLAPMWFSTMFPVYFFSGMVLAGLATVTLIAAMLQRSGRITDEIRVDHYHDMGKLMFAFIVFWGYIAFSQFMLIWYANIPEETFWFNIRFKNPTWHFLSIVLLVGHLFIPFLALMARSVRRNRTYMAVASFYLLVMHWIDVYWIIMPQITADMYALTTDFYFPLVELVMGVGFAGLFVAGFFGVAGNRSLIATGDPRIPEALHYHNV